ncbi:DUF4253 domain-containing protein [Nocardia sp. NPDC024068]|uniref:DUF4253 domain-containing protein n=1 Tax=Nocardia sp. NPDC024068 TaxID=3157197 RepID=UPI0033CFB586
MKELFGVPPFQPDLPAGPLAAPYTGTDPAATLAALGVEIAAPVVAATTASGAPVWTVPIEPGYDGPALWERIRELGPRTGLWPLLSNSDTWPHCGLGIESEPRDPGVPELSGGEWLTKEHTEYAIDPEAIPRGGPAWSELDLSDYDYTSFGWSDIWAIRPDCEEFDLLALIPAAAHWLIPQELDWSGAVNYDIYGAIHTAVLRRWSASRGCELVALDGDTMWLKIDKAVLDEDATLAMAMEAFLYCPDAATQDRDSLDELAAALLNPLWRLWWD